MVVSVGIRGVVVLVQHDGVRDFANDAVRDTNVRLGIVESSFGWSSYDFGSEGVDRVLLLARHLLRHDDDASVTFDSCNESQSNAGVSRSCTRIDCPGESQAKASDDDEHQIYVLGSTRIVFPGVM
jgi:hypothetical protein